jgi:polyisoprenoid-binding protein YceI
MNRFLCASWLLLLWILTTGWLNAQTTTYITSKGETSFFSETPAENISAANKKSQVLLNPSTGDIAVRMKMTDFIFPNKLMQEHFNENYMESEKFPVATFRGKLTSPVDFGKDGIYSVSVKGMLLVHGVSKDKTIEGTLEVKKGKVVVRADFDVALEDHKIEVPKIVFLKIAQVIKVKALYTMDAR